MQRFHKFFLATFLLFFACSTTYQARADKGYSPEISPLYKTAKGSVVKIDEGHNNYHTMGGRFAPFANLIKKDGYQVSKINEKFTAESLKGTDILVISNALHFSNKNNWDKPNPSAFSKDEITVIKKWINDGGCLLLIADHLPFSGAANELAQAFGFSWNNGYAFTKNRKGTITFSTKNKGLKAHLIIDGRNEAEKVDKFTTFTGSAFTSPDKAQPLLVFSSTDISLMPQKSWDLNKDTPKISIDGWHQGATLEHGKGRIAFFGEASAFTAQIRGKKQRKFGMNSPKAPQNYQFVLNVIHWLDKKI